jgi:hypothetical protein
MAQSLRGTCSHPGPPLEAGLITGEGNYALPGSVLTKPPSTHLHSTPCSQLASDGLSLLGTHKVQTGS